MNIKDLQNIIGVDQSTIQQTIIDIDPAFKKGNINRTLSDDLISKVCKVYGITLDYTSDQDARDGTLTITRSTESDVIPVSNMPIAPKPEVKIDRFAAIEAKVVVRSELLKLNTKRKTTLTLDEALVAIDKCTDRSKIKLAERDLRDPVMIELLLNNMKWLVMPNCIPRKTREYWNPATIKVIMNDRVNDYFIAFNDTQALYIFI